jgi:Family of unknown function (DUF6375)
MKIWRSYGSEHSMNLVLIGTFKDASAADQAKRQIDELVEEVQKEPSEIWDSEPPLGRRYSDAMLELFRKYNLNTIGPTELEQLTYEAHVEVKDAKIVVTTDESEVSAFIKLFIERGARVEVFSAHDYPEAVPK